MDGLETRDERLLIPRTCFSIEPGIYLPEFGIRSELNLYLGEEELLVTGDPIQQEIRRIMKGRGSPAATAGPSTQRCLLERVPVHGGQAVDKLFPLGRGKAGSSAAGHGKAAWNRPGHPEKPGTVARDRGLPGCRDPFLSGKSLGPESETGSGSWPWLGRARLQWSQSPPNPVSPGTV